MHSKMLGANLVKRVPGANLPSLAIEKQPFGLFLLWLAYSGLLVLGAVLLSAQGLWLRLTRADPTGLTLAIIVLFAVSTLWAGHRAWLLGRQWHLLDAIKDGQQVDGCWSLDYLNGRTDANCNQGVLKELLVERLHGPQEMLWWLNGIQLKIGLLGKVIGFSILALELGELDSFDPQQASQMLKSLTGGLGIALLTTITGLSGNILLGLQLMRIDRFADTLAAETLRLGEQRAASSPGQ